MVFAESVSEIFFKSVNIWQSYKQERDCFLHFARLANTLLKDAETARDNHVLASNFAKYLPIQKITHRLSNKPFLIRLLTIPQHIKYVATLPRPNLSLMACFSDMIVLQGSVATHARCGGILNIYLTANLPRNLPVKFSLKSIKI